MANIGLHGVWIAPFDEAKGLNDALTGGKKYAKAVAMAVNNTTSEATLNADDALDDSIKVITQANVNYTPNGFSPEEEADVLGYSTTAITLGDTEGLNAYGQAADTEGGLVTCAWIVPTRRSGEEKTMVLLYPKVKFSPADSEDYQTKGDNVQFSTPAYPGKAMSDANGRFRYKIGPFASVDAGKAWLGLKFGLASQSGTPGQGEG